MRRVAAGVLCTVLVLFVGPAASANKPAIQRTPVDDEFVDDSCGFDVDVHTTGFVVDILWTAADGSVRDFQAFPQGNQVITNVETGTSITVNISGPAHVAVTAGGTATLVGTGNWSWGGNPLTGEDGIFLTRGRFVMSLNTGLVTDFTGDLVGLCSRLAG